MSVVMSTVEVLENVRDLSIKLLDLITSGSNPVAEAADTYQIRQELVDQLPDGVGVVTPKHRQIANEIANMDTRIHAWCHERQREIAQHLKNRPRRSPPQPLEARIVCQLV